MKLEVVLFFHANEHWKIGDFEFSRKKHMDSEGRLSLRHTVPPGSDKDLVLMVGKSTS